MVRRRAVALLSCSGLLIAVLAWHAAWRTSSPSEVASSVPSSADAPWPSISATSDELPAVEDGYERVELLIGDDAIAAYRLLSAVGGRIEFQSHGRVQARVPRTALPLLESADLLRVDRPGTFVDLQIAGSSAVLGVDSWRAAGFTGHGARVAVLDSGFDGYQDALGNTLPRQVIAKSFRADGQIGGSDHGRRAAEIIARLAPNATLYLVNFSTVTELSAAVDYLIAERVDIVSFSLGYLHNGPGDGTGAVNQVISRGTQAGQAWSVASGNWAQQHWSGAYTDADADGVHEFAPGVERNGHEFQAGDLITLSLRWDEAWGGACADFDLELYGPDGGLVRSARSLQNCRQDPVESLQVLATRSGVYTARVLRAGDGPPRRLDLVFVGSPDRGAALEVSVPAGSLSEPGDNRQVITVGALTADFSREAPYSSRGPTADGRAKPDVLAPTGGLEAGGFSGTSSSAPHVAGVLALLQEAYPRAAREALTSVLLARALPLASDSGAPRAYIGAPIGLSPTLPAGASSARLIGLRPPGSGLALLAYQGPSGYPLRFIHLLAEGRSVRAVYRYDGRSWQAFLVGAPDFVNTFDRIEDGNILVVRFQ